MLVVISCHQHFNSITRASFFCQRRKQTVNADALTPTWQPMTSTIGVFGLLHFSLRTMAGENSLSILTVSVEDFSVNSMCQYFFLNNMKLKQNFKTSDVLIQMTAPLYVIPQCTSRGKQCFWRPAWRRRCTLHSLYMWTTVLLH